MRRDGHLLRERAQRFVPEADLMLSGEDAGDDEQANPFAGNTVISHSVGS